MPKWVRILLPLAPLVIFGIGLVVGYQISPAHQTAPRIYHGNALDNYQEFVYTSISIGQPATATSDGPATVTKYGRVYVGPNGAELRPNRYASELALSANHATTSDLPPLFKGVYRYLWSINTSELNPLPPGHCLGITVRPLALRDYLRSRPLAPGDLLIWKEKCAQL